MTPEPNTTQAAPQGVTSAGPETLTISYGAIKAKWPNRANEARQLRDGLGPDGKPNGEPKMTWKEIFDYFQTQDLQGAQAANPTPAPSAAVNTATMTPAQLQAEIARLTAENARMAKGQAAMTQLHLKISEKKALSIYGLGRWPVTLYKTQWQRLIGYIPQVQKFLKDNDHLLAEKGDTK